jgi:integrase
MSMGRPKQHDRHLPPRMRHKHGAYYRVANGKWAPLGREYGAALRKWAELEAAPPQVATVGEALDGYIIDAIPKLAAATQRDYRRICGELRRTFGDTALSDVEPTHVAQYLEKRSSPVAANREMAVLSSVYNYAMRLGHASSNPCRGVRRNREKPRTRLPTAAELAALRVAASPMVKAMIDVSLMTAMRKADLLVVTLADLTERGIEIRTSKTNTLVCFRWNEALREAVSVARGKRQIGPLFITRLKRGWTESGLDSVWDKLRQKAGVEGLHWHDLRAWSLTTAARIHGRERAQALGTHASPTTTDIYLRDRAVREVDPLDMRQSGE